MRMPGRYSRAVSSSPTGFQDKTAGVLAGSLGTWSLSVTAADSDFRRNNLCFECARAAQRIRDQATVLSALQQLTCFGDI